MRMKPTGWGRRLLAAVVAVAAWVAACGGLTAQTAVRAVAGTTEAVMMSDIHFDPFRDPAKAASLADAPVGEWNKILAEVDSPNQKEEFARVQTACHETAEDTPYALFQSSLKAMKEEAPRAMFATLSGDLLVHSLQCRYKLLLPDKTDSDYRAFTEKTANYVIGQVKLAFEGKPVYVALGNNDAWCKDYAIDPGSSFLTNTQDVVMSGLPLTGADRAAALASYADRGDYTLMMAVPMQKTRLIVLNNLYQSRRYTDCAGKPNPAPADAQNAWLEKELAGAKQRGERVWVLGHIPPGLDTYSTISQQKNVCKGDTPVMFLGTERLMDVMAKYADVIRLVIFGHTHMDEMRLFGGEDDTEGAKGKVAIKIVPSITPIASKVPSFMVAEVNPATAQMEDYTVYAASNATGVDTTWKKTYSFGATYQRTAFSPQALSDLMENFEADPEAQGSASGAYLRRVVAGEHGLLLRGLWPEYSCAMQHHTAKGFAACFCPEN
jgi:sphingomyelin phosphodiesterase acid-like 3